jgi:predicted ATPase
VDLADVEFIAHAGALAERLGRDPALLSELPGAAQGYFRELGCEPLLRPAGLAYEFYAKMWSGKELPLALAPSGIRETPVTALALLAPQYPRLLFIEEPEAHLHPGAVLEYAKLIASAVNSGKYVVISTHSDHLLVALNNMIALRSVKDRA